MMIQIQEMRFSTSSGKDFIIEINEDREITIEIGDDESLSGISCLAEEEVKEIHEAIQIFRDTLNKTLSDDE